MPKTHEPLRRVLSLLKLLQEREVSRKQIIQCIPYYQTFSSSKTLSRMLDRDILVIEQVFPLERRGSNEERTYTLKKQVSRVDLSAIELQQQLDADPE